MTTLLIISLALAMLLLGLLIGVVVNDYLLTPADRRQLEITAERLMAEQRIDALTRGALLAMRDAARGANRSG